VEFAPVEFACVERALLPASFDVFVDVDVDFDRAAIPNNEKASSIPNTLTTSSSLISPPSSCHSEPGQSPVRNLLSSTNDKLSVFEHFALK
jgi:hypothetical protein